MKKIIFSLIFVAFVFAEKNGKEAIYEEILPNGLKLLVVSDAKIPDVSCRLYYFVGSMFESYSNTGLSHFYEHLMFKGTKRLGTTNYEAEIPIMKEIDGIDSEILSLLRSGISPNDERILSLKNKLTQLQDEQRKYIIKDEIWSLYEKNGATGLNAWTSDDITAYIVTLPANKVELFANIEADRMQNLVLREFVSERDVVYEERRMRYENRPVNNYRLILESMFYSAHPYRNPTIGWASDIENYSTAALKSHIEKYYRPDNAIIVLAGNITPKAASQLANKYFAQIKNPKTEVDFVKTREPKPIGEKRFIVREKNAEPQIDIWFHTSGYPDSSLFALEIIENMLSGNSGILYKRLVEEEKLCTSVGAANFWRHHNGKFAIYAVLKKDISHEKVEKIILEEIEKLTKEEPKSDELLRVKNTLKRQHLEKFKNLEGFSDELAFFAKFGDWRGLFEYQDKIIEIKSTANIVKKYLDPNFRTVGWLVNE
ncbi:MAG: insulinase family protein [Chitinivibrionia bacterium]|nr:insulinase family protein [Chitinivibrionia bacterium]